MPSRDIRRAQKQKDRAVSETIEKRHQLHPFIYGFSIVVLVVIIVTFVLAGPGGPLSRGATSAGGVITFGSYQGHDITYSQGSYFAQDMNRIASQMRGQTSQNNEATQQAIWYQAFMDTAEHVAILVQAEKSGVLVSEDAVDKALLTTPAYLDENGKFSETRYLAASAIDKASTRKLARESLLTNTYVSDIMSGAKDGSAETAFVKGMTASERSFSLVSWPFTSFPDSEVRAYGEANKSRFVKIKVSRILVKSGETQAAEIRKKITDKTSTFEELAKTYSKDEYADKGGDMGWRYAYDLEADFESKDTAQKVLALKSGEVSDVLKGTFGWIVYRCDAEAVDADFTNPTVLGDVRTYITKYEKGKVEDYFNEKAGQFTRRAGEIGFDKAVKEASLKVVLTDFFPVNLGNVFSFVPFKAKTDSETPTNAMYSEDFFFRAFSVAKDQVTPPIVLDDQVLVAKMDAEKQLPDSTANLLGSWIAYAANQSVQQDLAEVLMTPDKLKDNFWATFGQLYPASTKQ